MHRVRRLLQRAACCFVCGRVCRRACACGVCGVHVYVCVRVGRDMCRVSTRARMCLRRNCLGYLYTNCVLIFCSTLLHNASRYLLVVLYRIHITIFFDKTIQHHHHHNHRNENNKRKDEKNTILCKNMRNVAFGCNAVPHILRTLRQFCAPSHAKPYGF